jgi:Rha family phage regulatory protein
MPTEPDMSKDVKSKIRANDTYRSVCRVLEEFGIERHDVIDQRPHPAVRFTYRGEERTFHFAGTPSSHRTPHTTESKLRRMLGMIKATTKPEEAATVERVEDHSAMDAARNPIITARDGEAMTNSRDVAAFFDKEHRDVLKAIDNLLAQEPELALRNFAQGVYTLPGTGQQQHRCFDMDRDGFTLLAMGFTGANALKWKRRYIAAFNAMETELRQQAGGNVHYMVPRSLPEALRLAADLAETVEQQKARIEADKPKVEFHDHVAEAINCQTIDEVAKVLGTGQNRLFAWLRDAGMLKPGNLPYQRFVDEGYFRVVERQFKDKRGESHTYTRTLVTGKGLAYIQKRFTDSGDAA